ncbi:coilin [Drosophila nasuta]|uniref:coilin n=1 Tax=Drosophila nasuta TaxID=42062 RepID=UPI00295ECEEE|nr:coilin [Drosophila nasuta]
MMNSTAMRVDLSNFFNDARQNSLIWISDSWANIKDVQDHIESIFRLTNISLLTQDGFYLSPKESIKVLQSVESIKAFTLSKTCSSKEELREASTLIYNGKKRKNYSSDVDSEFSSSTPINPKRSKGTNNTGELNLQSEETPKTEHSSRKSSKNKSKSQTTAIDNCDDDVELAESSNQLNLQSEETPKTEHSSRKSSKNKSKSQTTAIDNCDDDVELAESSMQTTLSRSNSSRQNNRQSPRQKSCGKRAQVQSFNVESSSNNHIIFADVEEKEAEQQQAEEKQPELEMAAEISNGGVPIAKPQVEFRCALEKMNPTVRVFKLPIERETLKILENIVIPAPERSTTPQENKDSIIVPLEAQAATANETKEAEVPEAPRSRPTATTPPITDLEHYEENLCETSSILPEQSLLETDSDDSDDIVVLDDTTMEASNSFEIIKDMLDNAAKLTDLPNIGETIIFKLTETKGASQQSAKTNYIAGTCSYINRRTKALTITVIASDSVPKNILRSYVSNLEDSTDGTLILNVNFRDLIDAKVVVSTVD